MTTKGSKVDLNHQLSILSKLSDVLTTGIPVTLEYKCMLHFSSDAHLVLPSDVSGDCDISNSLIEGCVGGFFPNEGIVSLLEGEDIDINFITQKSKTLLTEAVVNHRKRVEEFKVLKNSIMNDFGFSSDIEFWNAFWEFRQNR